MNFLSSTQSFTTGSTSNHHKFKKLLQERRAAAAFTSTTSAVTALQEDGETEGDSEASFSSWNSLASPSTSEFETISRDSAPPSAVSSDVEVVSPPAMDDGRSSIASFHSVDRVPPLQFDADDEDSPFEEEPGRGRGRDRFSRAQAVERSVLEDALRSSLSTLLTLTMAAPTQSPMASVLMSPLVSPPSERATASPRSLSYAYDSLGVGAAGVSRTLGESLLGEHWTGGDDTVSSDANSSSEDDDGTELAHRHRSPTIARPLTMSSLHRPPPVNHSTSLPNSFQSQSSPLLPSRPLPFRTSTSPNTTSSNPSSSTKWTRSGRRRGQRRESCSPAASPEERVRARRGFRGRDRAADQVDDKRWFETSFDELAEATKSLIQLSSPHSTPFLAFSPTLQSPRPAIAPIQPSDATAVDVAAKPSTTGEWPLSPSFSSGEFPVSSPGPTVDLDLSNDSEVDDIDRKVSRKRKESWWRWVRNAFSLPVTLQIWQLLGVSSVMLALGVGCGSIWTKTRLASLQ